MEIEIEFKWPLNNGRTVIVGATGYYVDGEIGFPFLGFVTTPQSDAETRRTFEAIQTEWAQIEQHAVITMCEQAREQIKEVEYT